jgi:carbamoyltransferase
MNSVANGKVRTHTPFKEVYVQPAASDNGTALGAAYFLWHQSLGRPRSFVMDHALWGTSYDDFVIDSVLKGDGVANGDFQFLRLQSSDETCRATAQLLAEGNIVGWFQGRMEWGARALGNRSILADPRRADIRDVINLKIKFREKFRPFAPSILEEAMPDYFMNAASDPFMQQVYPVRNDKRHVLPAITHVDGSGRLQTVNRNQNPLYYGLIQEFEKITGVPVLLNTSFNENEPIVDTPQQALDCFLRTKMDALVMGNRVVARASAKFQRDPNNSLSLWQRVG